MFYISLTTTYYVLSVVEESTASYDLLIIQNQTQGYLVNLNSQYKGIKTRQQWRGDVLQCTL